MTTYLKIFENPYNLSQLQAEINASSQVIPSLLYIVANDIELNFNFAAPLSADEEISLDSLLLSHTPHPIPIETNNLPYSRHLEGKIAVHSSAKPEPKNVTTYAIWSGVGDDPTLDEHESLGAGELLSFNITTGNSVVIKDIKFDPRHGRMWIHEAYVKFENGSVGDYLIADVMAPATPLQQVVDLNYHIDVDGWLIYSTGSPVGTHGLAGTPILVPRTFAKDGDWDYDGISLTPNFTKTGGYKITTIERPIHRYFNKIPLSGTSATYFTMSSEETAEIPVDLGYFIRVKIYNMSNSNWNVSLIMELYRERTVYP